MAKHGSVIIGSSAASGIANKSLMQQYPGKRTQPVEVKRDVVGFHELNVQGGSPAIGSRPSAPAA